MSLLDIRTLGGRIKLSIEGEPHGADLSGQDLKGVDLEGADLRGTNLSGARLVGARLDSAAQRLQHPARQAPVRKRHVDLVIDEICFRSTRGTAPPAAFHAVGHGARGNAEKDRVRRRPLRQSWA